MENAHPRLNARKSKFAMWYTHVRPYISESGPQTRGPIAKVNKNILKVRAVIVSLVMP